MLNDGFEAFPLHQGGERTDIISIVLYYSTLQGAGKKLFSQKHFNLIALGLNNYNPIWLQCSGNEALFGFLASALYHCNALIYWCFLMTNSYKIYSKKNEKSQ